MPRPEQIAIKKLMTKEELQKRIRILETDTKILQRLYFIKHRYDGMSVEEASRFASVAKPVGYDWQEFLYEYTMFVKSMVQEKVD